MQIKKKKTHNIKMGFLCIGYNLFYDTEKLYIAEIIITIIYPDKLVHVSYNNKYNYVKFNSS